MSRVAQYLLHTLFALNKQYFISDKYAKRLVDQVELQPPEFMTRLERVLSNPEAISRNWAGPELLTTLWLETVQLSERRYESRFHL